LGDQAAATSFFAGYRQHYGALVLGAEADFEVNSTSWSHAGNRNFGVDRGNALSASVVTGLQTESGNLFYGRFGIVSAAFDSSYQRGTEPAVLDDSRKTGLLIGVGAEVPLGKGLSGRMEYQLRAYDDYAHRIAVGTATPDNFANVESAVRFGLVYDFAPGATAANPPWPGISAVFMPGRNLGTARCRATIQGRVPMMLQRPSPLWRRGRDRVSQVALRRLRVSVQPRLLWGRGRSRTVLSRLERGTQPRRAHLFRQEDRHGRSWPAPGLCLERQCPDLRKGGHGQVGFRL